MFVVKKQCGDRTVAKIQKDRVRVEVERRFVLTQPLGFPRDHVFINVSKVVKGVGAEMCPTLEADALRKKDVMKQAT